MWIPERHYLIWCKFEPIIIWMWIVLVTWNFTSVESEKAGYLSYAAYFSSVVSHPPPWGEEQKLKAPKEEARSSDAVSLAAYFTEVSIWWKLKGYMKATLSKDKLTHWLQRNWEPQVFMEITNEAILGHWFWPIPFIYY